jgi:hypothetical protein
MAFEYDQEDTDENEQGVTLSEAEEFMDKEVNQEQFDSIT